MRRRLSAIAAAIGAAVIALLLAVTVNLGVLRAVGDPEGPGHLSAIAFSATPSGADVRPASPNGTAPRGGVPRAPFAPSGPESDGIDD